MPTFTRQPMHDQRPLFLQILLELRNQLRKMRSSNCLPFWSSGYVRNRQKLQKNYISLPNTWKFNKVDQQRNKNEYYD